jgi:polar amino acid transport system substrate-binding protein
MNIKQIFLALLLYGSTTVYAADVVKIAVEDDWAPYAYLDASTGEPKGFSVDLVKALFKKMNIELELVVVPFSRCLFYAETGHTHGCFNATIISGNQDTYYWHSTPMFHEDLAIFGHISSEETELGPNDLVGKSVGYTLGYTYPTEVMENNEITLFGVNSDDQLLEMLALQHIDLIMINEMPGYLRASELPNVAGQVRKVGTVSSDGFWLAFSKSVEGNLELVNKFEQALVEFKKSGEYHELYQSFLNTLK